MKNKKTLIISLVIATLFTVLGEEFAYCKSNTRSQKYSKATTYNSKGQKTGYYKVYKSRDKVTKVEKYGTNGKRQQRTRFK